jgi:hypothetical protein
MLEWSPGRSFSMPRTIDQFIWGYQAHFRLSVQRSVQEVLQAIGADLEPEVFLVGFQVDGEHRWPICIEPERGPFHPDQLMHVSDLARGLYENDPERQILQSNREVHEQRQRLLQDQARARALADALEAADRDGRRFLVGSSSRVVDYDVYPVIAVLAERMALFPSLSHEQYDRIPTERSLVHAALHELLRLSARALLWPDCGGALSAVMDAVSTLPYEGRAGAGTFVLARQSHPAVIIKLRLRSPVSLRSTRSVRKLLEMTGKDLSLLTDGNVVFGLGSLKEQFGSGDEDIFTLRIVSRGTWELEYNSLPLLRVDNAIPSVPKPRMSRERFADTVLRVLWQSDNVDVDWLWNLALAAADTAHGTMLVVTDAASTEAERLQPQAWAIDPILLTVEGLMPLTNIDGAVLLNPSGRCHAVGVILDGSANGNGDPARGARFNSAIRYLSTTTAPTVIIIVSEDGMIDVMPYLKPRIAKHVLDEAVQAVAAAGEHSTGDYEAFFKAWERAEALRFYFAPEQCHVLNAARERVEEQRWQTAGMRIDFTPLEPDPDMNDSYSIAQDRDAEYS